MMGMRMVNNGKWGWSSLLYSDAPEGCSLRAALFTTYDRADERFLAENLLPLLLKLDRKPSGENNERGNFLLELDDRLKKLHDRIVVVSSTLREEASGEEPSGQGGVYGWIWRSIRHLTVGRQGKAVQHAKLWLLHWVKDGGEYLEIVVSSANLASSAFREQIQAAWRVCIELLPQTSQVRERSWGILPCFMRELAASAGDYAHLDYFVKLLARAECPQGTAFVASVPGNHTPQVLRRTPWGASGLREIIPAGSGTPSASVLSPFIGAWSQDALNQWCARFGGSPERVSLAWIDKNHPWAKNWLLPATSRDSLDKVGATLLQLRFDQNNGKQTDRFHNEHKEDVRARWSHAKVYTFKRGRSRRLLLTSANFSTAAWGVEGSNGTLSIENFELGVCIENTDWPLFENLMELDAENAAISTATMRRSAALISWAQATWDGKKITVECKSERDVTGQVLGMKKPLPITGWAKGAGNLRKAQVPWVHAGQPPLSVLLICEDEKLNVAIFDERKPDERKDSFPPGVDEDEAAVQSMRDYLLFERYGGRVAPDDGPQSDEVYQTVNGDEPLQEIGESQAAPSDSYAVPAFVRARLHLQVVDNWAGQIKPRADKFVLEILQRDGQSLMEAFKRQVEREGKDGMGARLAAEEMELRLKHFPGK